MRGFLKMASVLRKKYFDVVIDLQNNRRSHILSFLTLAPERYGYDNKKCGFLLNNRIPDNKPLIDPVTHKFRVLKMVGVELTDPHLELWPSAQDERFVDELLDTAWISRQQKLIGINISASLRWATKLWPSKYLVKLCEALGHRDIRVVLTGTEADVEAAGRLMNEVKNVKPIVACGKTTVNQLACVIKRCNVYISLDSAPLHIAASVNTPFVAIFGPTDPRRHLPPGKNYIVIRKELSCSPCYKPQCRHRKCMESIKPEEVLEAVEKLMR
jgi:lipopolysaccharide heptosyltransferase II